MHSITTEQNADRQLLRLAAQRQLYATAKSVFGMHFFFSGPVAAASILLAIGWPSIKGYVALWGMLILLMDLLLFTPWQKRLRESAARIQESFDCDVLDLPWNGLKVGKVPDSELVKEQAEKYARWADTMPPLTDWYPLETAELPPHIGRIVCQRANCWWDAKQRRRYALVIIGGVAAVVVVMFVASLGREFTVDDFVLKAFAPLAPMLALGIRQFIENTDAAARLDKLKEHSEQLWGDALGGRSESQSTIDSRSLQDEIFDSRKRSPFVFDSIFKWLRRDYELQMNHGASELVAEARRRLSLT